MIVHHGDRMRAHPQRIALVMALGLAASCSPPERQRVVNFFFDVPASAPAAAGSEASESQPRPAERLPGDLPAFTSSHKPFMQRKCGACHEPQSNYQVPVPQTALCRQCHEKIFEPRQFTHGPVAAGACSQCHLPHVSSQPKLQRECPPQQCVRCHEMKEKPICPGRARPLSPTCLTCHDPHSADEKFLLLPRGDWQHLLEPSASAPATSPH